METNGNFRDAESRTKSRTVLAGIPMTEPTKEEIEAVQAVLRDLLPTPYCGDRCTCSDFDEGARCFGGSGVTTDAIAKAVIKALDEHRAAEAPPHREDD